MKNLKIYAKSGLSVLAMSMLLIFSSCKDECKDVVCDNGGVCVEGACDCNAGYEGTNCETAWRTKFLKTGADVTEVCSGTSAPAYVVDIIAGTAVTEIKIKNLGNYNCSAGDYYVTATLTGSNNLSIASKEFFIADHAAKSGLYRELINE